MSEAEETAWADALSQRAISALCVGLLALTTIELMAASKVSPNPAMEAGACMLSVGATGLAIASGNPSAVAGAFAAVVQCLPMLLGE